MTRLKNYLSGVSIFTVFGMVFVLVTSIALLLSFTITKNLTLSQVDHEVMADTQIIAELSSDYVNQVMSMADDILHNTAISMKSMDESSYNDLLYEVQSQNDLFTMIEVVDETGLVIYSSSEFGSTIGVNRSNDVPYQKILSGESTSFTTSLNSLDSGKSMTLAKNEDGLIFIGYISLYDLYETLTEYISNQTRVFNVVITDEYGIYLAGSNYRFVEQRRRFELFDAFSKGMITSGSSFEMNIEDEKYIVSTASFDVNEWYLFVYEDTATLESRFYKDFVVQVILGIVTIIVVGVSYIMLTAMFKKLLDKFIGTTEAIAKGDYSVKMPHANYKEFNSLSVHFERMRKSIQDRNDELYNIAYFDSLTGLVTRTRVLEEFESGKYERAAFAYIDLNKFKTINDTYGHIVGDAVLKQLGTRLNNVFNKENEMIARIGGDELLLVVFDYENKEQVHQRVNLLSEIEKVSYETNNVSVYLSFSVGLSYYPEDGIGFEYLMSCADIAMYDLRMDRKGSFSREYTEVMRLGFDRKTVLSTEIVRAIERNDFSVVYQPIIDVKDKRVRGFEALSRWNHESLGVVHPNEFIKILEDKELIDKLDLGVLVQASYDIELLRKKHNFPYILSVNFSAIHLARPDFFEVFTRMIEEYNIDSTLLEIEITESAMIQDFDYIKEVIAKLNKMKISVSEDDFGTGYSSLTYLLQLDLSILKIPREFLNGYNKDDKSTRIINSLVALSNELGLKVVVEGVEDAEQARVFSELGVDFIQGFYYGRPMKIDHALVYET